jgi:hypothetical protein
MFSHQLVVHKIPRIFNIPNAPPSSLMDFIANPNVKTMKGKNVGVRSLARNISGVQGHVGALGWD